MLIVSASSHTTMLSIRSGAARRRSPELTMMGLVGGTTTVRPEPQPAQPRVAARTAVRKKDLLGRAELAEGTASPIGSLLWKQV